jgi:hypothetical protein
MGWGALIGGVVSGIASGVGAATKGGGGGGSGVDAGTIKRARQIYIDPFTNANYWNLDVPGAFQQSWNIGQQVAPGINQFNQQQLTNMLNQTIPGWQGMYSQMGTNVTSELGGNIPQDVQNQIQRFGAQQQLTSGIGGAGGVGPAGAGALMTGKTITARDLGLTSLSLMNQGQTGFGNMLALAKNYLMPQPVNPMSLLPFEDLVAGQQWSKQAQFQANLAGFTASADQAGAMLQLPNNQASSAIGGIGGALSGLFQTNPNTGTSPISNLFNLFGGGGGGGSGAMTDIGGGVFGGGASGDPFGAGGTFAF